MIDFLLWYICISALGWLTFPLVFSLFPALSDRGYSLARVVGLLLWGYGFWILASFGIAQNDSGGLILAGMILVGISTLVMKNRVQELKTWIKDHLRVLIVVEGLFLLAFISLAVLRAANPEILGTEKPMELAFINAILRSPNFPPRDPWLSGFSISYYYFGYVMAAMLAKITGVSGSIAFNLMLALVFALGASGAYGIIYNLMASIQKVKPGLNRKNLTVIPILGPLFLLIASNLDGFLEVIHQRGLFWKFSQGGAATSKFWTWLDIKDLNLAPSLPTTWLPDRYLWWWRASRVVQDTTLQKVPQELIDEFPFFSYLLGDLHPHVLSVPFILLAVSVGLNLFLGGWRGKTRFLGISINIQWPGLIFPALVLGGLAFLNTWDILIALALVCGSFLLWRGSEQGWSWRRVEEVFGYALIVGIGSLLFYLPFFTKFSSQAGGILPNIVNPTRGAHLWVMFGILLIPIFTYLAYLIHSQKKQIRWKFPLFAVLGLVVILWILSLGASWIVYLRAPDVAKAFLDSQGVSDFSKLITQAFLRRFDYLGGLLTIMLILIGSFALLTNSQSKKNMPMEQDEESSISAEGDEPGRDSLAFVLMLTLLGGLLVLAPDFVFLRDQFGWRINTIFKFYYQAWILWSLVAALGTAVLLSSLKGIWDWIFRSVITLVILMALIYPVLGIQTKTNNFKPSFGWSLDGAAYIARDNLDDSAAIDWLRTAPDGVIVEAVGGSYSGFARISTLSGLPTVLGWPGHEAQWRGSYTPMGNRQEDIKLLYESSNWEEAEAILSKYNIRYVIIGSLERSTYHVKETKFQQNLQNVFSQGILTIYATH